MPVASGQPLESQLLQASSPAEGGRAMYRDREGMKVLDPGLLPLKSNSLILKIWTGGGLTSDIRVKHQGKDCNNKLCVQFTEQWNSQHLPFSPLWSQKSDSQMSSLRPFSNPKIDVESTVAMPSKL